MLLWRVCPLSLTRTDDAPSRSLGALGAAPPSLLRRSSFALSFSFSLVPSSVRGFFFFFFFSSPSGLSFLSLGSH